MSRQYDDHYVEIPIEIFWGQDFATLGGVDYARLRYHPDYIVTSVGDVISIRNPDNPRYLKPWHNNHGHLYVQIDGEKVLVHRLIANAFLSNRENYPLVRHLNDEPTDNRISNLRWGTHKDNRDDSIRNGHDYRREVYCFETNEVYRSMAETERQLGVSKEQICWVCKGKSDYAKGYHFCYAEEMEEKKNDPKWMHNHSPYKPVIAYGPNGERLCFNSRKEASEELGIPDCGISSVITGKLRHTHGWRFEDGERVYD